MTCITLSIQTMQFLACYEDPDWSCYTQCIWKHWLQLPSAHVFVNQWHIQHAINTIFNISIFSNICYNRILCIQPAITAPAITLPDHKAAFNARCGCPFWQGKGKPLADKSWQGEGYDNTYTVDVLHGLPQRVLCPTITSMIISHCMRNPSHLLLPIPQFILCLRNLLLTLMTFQITDHLKFWIACLAP